ncbi:unnamed protein product, partial [Laminaria digitata]
CGAEERQQEESVTYAPACVRSAERDRAGIRYGDREAVVQQRRGGKKRARRIKPSLSPAQKLRRIDFICDQVDETTGDFLDQFNVIQVDESWFFLLRTKEKIRMFPGEHIPGAPRVQHKSHLPKITIIVANARPDPTHNFDGKIGIWRICVMKTAERSSKKRKRG